MMSRFICACAVLSFAIGCAPQQPKQGNYVTPARVSLMSDGPADAPPGTCWGRDEKPLVIETVSTTVRSDDGNDPSYKTVNYQRIVEDGGVIWFETPCMDVITTDFMKTLQRALALRGFYDGAVNGRYTPQTAQAIRAFQKPQGLNSAQLSVVAARKLGIVSYDRNDIAQF
ncbi:MAG: peptidoglycan-binding domain-containing protein [Pseudomonadota bacterium]